MLVGFLSSILWFAGCFIVGAIIGGILGDFVGEIVCFVDDIICLLPIPKIFSRIIFIVGSSVLVYLFCDEGWFWGLAAWWGFYIYCVHYAQEVTGGDDEDL